MGIPDHGDEDAQPDEGLTEEHCDPLEHHNHTLKVASKAGEEEEDFAVAASGTNHGTHNHQPTINQPTSVL